MYVGREGKKVYNLFYDDVEYLMMIRMSALTGFETQAFWQAPRHLMDHSNLCPIS